MTHTLTLTVAIDGSDHAIAHVAEELAGALGDIGESVRILCAWQFDAATSGIRERFEGAEEYEGEEGYEDIAELANTAFDLHVDVCTIESHWRGPHGAEVHISADTYAAEQEAERDRELAQDAAEYEAYLTSFKDYLTEGI